MIVGVTRQSYAKWEQGDSVPDIEKCDKLAKFYGIKIDALMQAPPCACAIHGSGIKVCETEMSGQFLRRG